MSLSNPRVISLLNGCYVPVFLSNEDFRRGGAASAADRAELDRIHREGYRAGLSVGSVHAYLLAPDGRLVDSMHTVQVSKPNVLAAALERQVRALGVDAGKPLAPVHVAVQPACDAGGLRLRLVARYLESRDGELRPVVNAGGNWSALPSEDWIVLSRAEVRGLTPARIGRGAEWDLPAEICRKLLVHFYPPTENWELETNRIEIGLLMAKVEPALNPDSRPVWRVSLAGSLRMKHPFYHKDDSRFVEAKVAGILVVRKDGRVVESLSLVTDSAVYGDGGGVQPFGVAVETVP